MESLQLLERACRRSLKQSVPSLSRRYRIGLIMGGKERGGDMREGRGERGGFTAAWAGSSMRSRISSMFEAPALLWVDEKTSQEEEEEEG